MITKEKLIENYLNKRFPYKDQIQEKNNFGKELYWFLEYVLSETERIKKEKLEKELDKYHKLRKETKEIFERLENAESLRNNETKPRCSFCKIYPTITKEGACAKCNLSW